MSARIDVKYDLRSEQLLLVAQGAKAAGRMLATESGRNLVGMATAVRSYLRASEYDLAEATLDEIEKACTDYEQALADAIKRQTSVLLERLRATPPTPPTDPAKAEREKRTR